MTDTATSRVIRLATVEDANAVGAMIDAMDIHYRGDSARRPPSEARDMVRQCLETTEGTRFLLALDNGRPCGVACFVIIRPGALLTGLLYLKDLFVIDTARGNGVGRALLTALAEFAVQHGLGRLDFTTETTNIGAQRLYDSLGGARQQKILYRFEGPTLQSLARARLAGRDTT